MPSFDTVNYSLRPSKAIQRHIIFEGVQLLKQRLNFDSITYIGLGSVWFTDFVLAHKILGINNMISIEADEVGYSRARFNAPYATVDVRPGNTNSVLPELCSNEKNFDRPWMVWLDFDGAFNEETAVDVRTIIEKALEDSILIITFNGHDGSYGRKSERVQRLKTLFGEVVPDQLASSDCKGDRMQETLANIALDFMRSIALDFSRPGGFLSAFRIIYKDSAPMITVGGLLPSKGSVNIADNILKKNGWKCMPHKRIEAPNLTIREVAALQAMLPRARQLTRKGVQRLGFDLHDQQIETFQKYYREYPAFAQIFA